MDGPTNEKVYIILSPNSLVFRVALSNQWTRILPVNQHRASEMPHLYHKWKKGYFFNAPFNIQLYAYINASKQQTTSSIQSIQIRRVPTGKLRQVTTTLTLHCKPNYAVARLVHAIWFKHKVKHYECILKPSNSAQPQTNQQALFPHPQIPSS